MRQVKQMGLERGRWEMGQSRNRDTSGRLGAEERRGNRNHVPLHKNLCQPLTETVRRQRGVFERSVYSGMVPLILKSLLSLWLRNCHLRKPSGGKKPHMELIPFKANTVVNVDFSGLNFERQKKKKGPNKDNRAKIAIVYFFSTHSHKSAKWI